MNLKNYTSSVPAATTISYIETYLADAGVIGIMKQYDSNKQPSAIMFGIQEGDRKFTVRLPVNFESVHDWLWRDYVSGIKKPRKQKGDFLDQAVRTAWKIQQDWVQVQMSLIKLRQAMPVEVFMPYIWDGEQTVYQRIKAGGMKALPQSTS